MHCEPWRVGVRLEIEPVSCGDYCALCCICQLYMIIDSLCANKKLVRCRLPFLNIQFSIKTTGGEVLDYFSTPIAPSLSYVVLELQKESYDAS